MSVCRQIRLVLWKNFTIRRRRWPRVIFEVLWPLFLFLILMWVRTRNLTVYYNACHNDPKYLGSAGVLPALQTFLCRWNNTCHNYSSTDKPLDPGTILWQSLGEFRDNLVKAISDKDLAGNVSELLQQVNLLNTYANSWNGTILVNRTTSDFNQSIPAAMVTALFANPVNLTNLHQPWMVNRAASASTINVAIEIYYASVQPSYTYSYRSDTVIKEAFCVGGEFNRTFSIQPSQWIATHDFLCMNLSSANLKTFLIAVQQQLDSKLLTTMGSTILSATLDGLQVFRILERIRAHLIANNISLPLTSISNSLSLTSLCGGRNDLSSVVSPRPVVRPPSSARQSPKQARILQERVSTTGGASGIDWTSLAFDLLTYGPSEICQQSYIIGSGDAKKTIVVDRACRCVLFDQTMNSNDELKKAAGFIRPLLYGKIYYHPSNKQYDRLIKQMNETFESLEELVKLFRQARSFVDPTFKSYLELCNVLTNRSLLCGQNDSYVRPLALFTIVTEFIACFDRNRFVPASDEAALVFEGQNKSSTNRFLAGIKFLDDLGDNDPLPTHLRYKIRMTLDYVDNTFRTTDRYFTYQPRVDVPGSTKYHTLAFIYLQNAIDRAIIKAHTGVNPPYGVQTQQMPYPCWINDKFVNAISRMLPLFMVLSWIFTVSMNVKDIVYEKEKRLKEIMRIMGLNDSVHWFTWFVLCTTVMMFIALLLVIILKFGKITQFSNFLILLIFFVCYTFATITQCFLISTFFNRANLAACGAGILFFVLYLPYTVLVNYDTQTETWHKVLASLSSTVAFGLGCDYIARFEGMAQGIQWTNIKRGARPDDNFTFLNCLIMMLADAVIYLLLTLYIENVFPGEYGIPQRWYYPVTKTYWFGFDAKKIRERTEEMKRNQGSDTISVEGDDALRDEDVGVEIQNLSKYYKNKVALKHLSVKFYRNMITAFLGRNGAGKSTTWSILTGLIPPSSGTALIDGYDILTDIKMVRKRLGFAPQHNILFDRLTVKEHLSFFSALKDAPDEGIEEEAMTMLGDLGLEAKAKNYSSQLSGGMKRKLSIAIAFIGNSTTVILDEPTAGVDPFARRAIWDLILKYKPGRTIVLSTHHLDEADLLSDRLAIISSGELKCVGTTMHLKRKYGEGYHLIVELKSKADEGEYRDQEPMYNPDENEGVDPINILLEALNAPAIDEPTSPRFEQLTDFLKTHMSDIRVKEYHGDQITYVVLDDAAHTKIFPTMLADLDRNTAKYRVKSYGLSNSSLEQVFLRVADEIKRPEDYERMSFWKKLRRRIRACCGKADTTKEGVENPATDLAADDPDDEPFGKKLSDEWSTYAAERYTGVRYLGLQISGLLIKRFHRTKRNIKGLIAEILLPILFVLLAMLVTKLTPNETEPPPLILHPWYWGRPNYMFQSSPTPMTSPVSRSVQETFTRSPSLGTRCLASTMLDKKKYPCDSSATGYVNVPTSSEVTEALNSVDYSRTRRSPDCDCEKKMQTCPIGAGGPAPSFDVTETRDVLYRLANYNITDWAVKTEYRDEYLMKRFGGIEFLAQDTADNVELLSETFIDQIQTILNVTGQSLPTFISAKIVPLFRIYPPHASIWYNNKGWPSSVAFLNIFNNALLRGLLLQKNPPSPITDYGITAINHPLPQTDIQLDGELQARAALEVFTAICVIFALAFIPASFLVFIIDERVTTSKHLQFVSGVKGITYWWSNFVWDITNYCVSITLCIIIFLAFGIEAYIYKINFLCLVLLLFFYGFAIIPMMYPISYCFKNPSTGFVVVSCINIFIGLITTIATYTLESFDDDEELVRVNKVLMKAFLIFPHYCLGRGLFDMSKTHAVNQLRLKYTPGYVSVSPLSFDIVGRNLLALSMQGLGFLILTILVQYRFFIPDRGCIRTPKDLTSANEDDDVAAERQRIYADPSNTSGDVLRMIDLVKVYGWRFGKKFTAVKRTCAGVKQGECFGLLGINGSGKSTTFKMLTGEISMTDGNAFVNNFSVIKQLDDVHQNLGYCPQFDALDSLLTAREHLYLYARLRGIKSKNISYITESLLKRLGLTLWADRPVRQYSGGNKRKLSTAISLIGNPSIIFMDEPTTGMDVRAKRFLWNCILMLTREDHRSVVITSHSMEECETLCNRLVIMVNGEMKCLGSVQHLKAKFGDGYTILVRTAIDSSTHQVIDYIQAQIPEAHVKEEHNKMIHFRVSTQVPLHRMFSVLEKGREDLQNIIEDYTVTQVTLDDVFVNFAKRDEENQKLEDANKSNQDQTGKKNLLRRLFHRKQTNQVELSRL